MSGEEDRNHCSNEPPTPLACDFSNSLSCGTESNALAKSIKIQ